MSDLPLKLPRFAGFKASIASALTLFGLFAASFTHAQIRMEIPLNIVSLQASGHVEAQQDLLRISLNTTKEGADANSVQAQLKTALDAALQMAKAESSPQQLEVRTGGFGLYPRHANNGKMNGWQGTTELILEGRDFARISALAGKINTLTLGQVSFGLSRGARDKLESEAQAIAIASFREKAQSVAKQFGFADFTLREVNVNASGQGQHHQQPMMMRAARAEMADSAVPVEAGKTQVVVNVNGSVQMK